VATSTSIRYEPFEQAGRDRLFETYEVLRDEAPVYRTESGYWVVSRFDDVKNVLLSPERFSSSAQQDEAFGLSTTLDPNADPAEMAKLMAIVSAIPVDVGELLQSRIIIGADAPVHTRIRRIVVRGFSAKHIARYEQQVKEIVAERIAGVEAASEFELISQLAEPLPVQMIGDIIGVAPADRHLIRDWSDKSTRACLGETRGTIEATQMLMEVLRDFGQYFVGLIESRRTHPTDDLISTLVRAEESETLTTTEAVMFLLAVMEAGMETSTSLIGNMVLAFLQHPEQLRILLDNPSLVENAVEEAGRYRAPVQFFFRRATGDQRLSGVTIPDGETVLLLIGAANTDPRHFGASANEFDIRRDTSSVLTFGAGPHFCLGNALGRLELRNVLRALAPHLPRFTLADEPLELQASCLAYGYERILLRAR
jgi:cytochrome P450